MTPMHPVERYLRWLKETFARLAMEQRVREFEVHREILLRARAVVPTSAMRARMDAEWVRVEQWQTRALKPKYRLAVYEELYVPQRPTSRDAQIAVWLLLQQMRVRT